MNIITQYLGNALEVCFRKMQDYLATYHLVFEHENTTEYLNF